MRVVAWILGWVFPTARRLERDRAERLMLDVAIAHDPVLSEEFRRLDERLARGELTQQQWARVWRVMRAGVKALQPVEETCTWEHGLMLVMFFLSLFGVVWIMENLR